VAGRKTFVSGEILTAADVNGFLMDQAVQVYDDATARDTALPSPVEGQIVYLKDNDTVQKFDGSDFLPVGGLVATKSVLKTDTFTASVTQGGNADVTGLSITHEVSNPANKLIISAFVGKLGTSNGRSSATIALAQDGTLIGVGDADGSRTRISAGGHSYDGTVSRSTLAVTSPSFSFVHTPGAGSKVYQLRVFNTDNGGTLTLFVNRNQGDENDDRGNRGVSSLIIQEVAV
jgi:hypothetical protein